MKPEPGKCARCGKDIEIGPTLCPRCAEKLFHSGMTAIEVSQRDAEKLEEAALKIGISIANLIEWLVEENLDRIVEEEMLKG